MNLYIILLTILKRIQKVFSMTKYYMKNNEDNEYNLKSNIIKAFNKIKQKHLKKFYYMSLGSLCKK